MLDIIIPILTFIPIFIMLVCATIIAVVFTISQVKDFIEEMKTFYD